MTRTVCFCGSFKFYTQMEAAARKLRERGISVIVPAPSHVRWGHKPEELKTGRYDRKTLTQWEGKGAYAHLDNIRTSDAIYVFNHNSYLGPAVTIEIGFALALGKPIFAKLPVRDITVTNFITAVVSPESLTDYLFRKVRANVI